jgi:hypothetical protein
MWPLGIGAVNPPVATPTWFAELDIRTIKQARRTAGHNPARPDKKFDKKYPAAERPPPIGVPSLKVWLEPTPDATHASRHPDRSDRNNRLPHHSGIARFGPTMSGSKLQW